MKEGLNSSQSELVMDALLELNCILLEGTISVRLMRLYALREIALQASPETLFKIAADLAAGQDAERKAA